MHDYIIILIIAVIIGIQIFIFGKNMSKIRNYKKTIEDVKDFEIVEVSVPEEWIKEIDVEEILQNPEKFQELSTNILSSMEEIDEDPETFLDEEEQINSEFDEAEIEEEELLELKLKGNSNEPELVFPDDEDSEIEEFEEEDFEEYNTNR
jgi:DNA-directed RNA polymerase subunit delta